MATIALYADKVSQMTRLIAGVKQSVIDYKAELTALRTRVMSTNNSLCNMDDVIASIKASTEIQDRKIKTLEIIQTNVEEFITDAVRIDNDVADLINRRKDDFYKNFSHLKPDSEMNGWDKFVNGCKKAVEWCRDNWKSIGKIVLAVVIIAALGVASVLTGGILAVILAGAFWGALGGALIGGAVGGITSAMNGGSILDGIADGMLSGTVTGAITGAACAGIGVIGAAFGKGISCLSNVGKAVQTTSRVTRVLSQGMDGFDMVSMGVGLFDPSHPLVELNQTLHSNKVYTTFQTIVNVAAIFTAGAASTMKCFVAGTKILTASGMVAIETVKIGDKVISTNPETFETAEKEVVEAYIRETAEVVHLTVNGELITSTVEHPFYVYGVGFVSAHNLYIGDKLLDSGLKIQLVENIKVEVLKEPIKVYNFQVEGFHTYHVGEYGVLVHNANCRLIANKDGTYDVELSYKKDWTPAQRLEADRKVKALSEAVTVKTESVRSGTSASDTYKSVYGKNSVTALQDVDHTIDLQLGGADNVLNMNPLDRSVNRSLGSQISHVIKNLDFGAVLANFRMI